MIFEFAREYKGKAFEGVWVVGLSTSERGGLFFVRHGVTKTLGLVGKTVEVHGVSEQSASAIQTGDMSPIFDNYLRPMSDHPGRYIVPPGGVLGVKFEGENYTFEGGAIVDELPLPPRPNS